jgi:hypothetical protein
MRFAKLEPAFPANERPQTRALYHAATGKQRWTLRTEIYLNMYMRRGWMDFRGT